MKEIESKDKKIMDVNMDLRLENRRLEDENQELRNMIKDWRHHYKKLEKEKEKWQHDKENLQRDLEDYKAAYRKYRNVWYSHLILAIILKITMHRMRRFGDVNFTYLPMLEALGIDAEEADRFQEQLEEVEEFREPGGRETKDKDGNVVWDINAWVKTRTHERWVIFTNWRRDLKKKPKPDQQ